jgi:hypothetical protein
MPNKKPEAATAATYEPDTIYEVRLRRPVTIEGAELLPINLYQMTGSSVALIAPEDIADVSKSTEV